MGVACSHQKLVTGSYVDDYKRWFMHNDPRHAITISLQTLGAYSLVNCICNTWPRVLRLRRSLVVPSMVDSTKNRLEPPLNQPQLIQLRLIQLKRGWEPALIQPQLILPKRIPKRS